MCATCKLEAPREPMAARAPAPSGGLCRNQEYTASSGLIEPHVNQVRRRQAKSIYQRSQIINHSQAHYQYTRSQDLHHQNVAASAQSTVAQCGGCPAVPLAPSINLVSQSRYEPTTTTTTTSASIPRPALQPTLPHHGQHLVRRPPLIKLPVSVANGASVTIISSVARLLIVISATVCLLQRAQAFRMVRLCIASVDPVKLSSQCVMCSRQEFPLTVMDCTGITKVNDLISNPLSVKDATCLIYNCRRQVPDIKPEPYHGSLGHSARTANYASASRAFGYEVMAAQPPQLPPPPAMYGPQSMSLLSRLAAGFTGPIPAPSSMMPARTQAMPYAIVPAPYGPSMGGRRYKAALIPLYR